MERVVPTEGELRKRRADIGAVLLVDHTVVVHVLELQVAGPYCGGLVEHAVGGILFSLGRIENIIEVLIYAFNLEAVEIVE